MNDKRKTLLGIFAFALLLILAYFAYHGLQAQIAPPTTELPPPMEAPDFTVYDKDGVAVKLSDFKGKPVVLNFWASWCTYCKTEMPVFDALSTERTDVAFLMIDMVDGSRETKEKGAAYIAQHDYTFPVYYDINQEVAYAYAVDSLPITFFINQDGEIVTGAQGALTEAMLRKGLDYIS